MNFNIEPQRTGDRKKASRKLRLVRAAMTLVLSIFLICILIITSKGAGLDTPWWIYGGSLFLFLGAFSRLVSVMFDGKLQDVSNKMKIISYVCLIVSILFYAFYFFALR